MSKMTTTRDLFLHELGDVLYAENVLVKALPRLAKEATDEDLRVGFEEHLAQTKEHVRNVEQVFVELGEKAKAERCPGIEGIQAEHDAFMADEQPSPAIRDLFLTGAGARTEHYEIAAYTGLVTVAKALGEHECASLLETNLDQETAALSKLERISRRLATDAKQLAAV
jgi:ferritin-like metal-binding protein YciE